MSAIEKLIQQAKFGRFGDNWIGIADTAAAELAALVAERDELLQLAKLAFAAIEEVGFEDLKPAMKALDHFAANELSDETWNKIEALKVTK